MGSTGSGRFTDYPGSQGQGAGADRDAAAAAGREEGSESAGASDDDQCLRPIPEVALEEVERCAYFTRTGGVPPAGTDVMTVDQLVGGRIAVAIATDAEVVGFLPTRLNYVLGCLQQGYGYPGEVTASTASPLAVVRVALEPTA
jgi:hypothetical protein